MSLPSTNAHEVVLNKLESVSCSGRRGGIANDGQASRRSAWVHWVYPRLFHFHIKVYSF